MFSANISATASVAFMENKDERRAEKAKIYFADFLDSTHPKERV